MDYTIEAFDMGEIGDNDQIWDIYFDFMEKNHVELYPRDPTPQRSVETERQKFIIEGYRQMQWLVYHNESIVGWAYIGHFTEYSPYFEDNGHLGQANVILLENHRRKGIGSRLLRTVMQEFSKIDHVSTVTCGGRLSSGKVFLEKMGAKQVQSGIDLRLYLEDVNWETINSWQEEAKKKHPSVEVQSFEIVPEEIIDQFTALYSMGLGQAISEEERYKPVESRKARRDMEKMLEKMGNRLISLVLIENDRILGLTEVGQQSQTPHMLNQGLTTIHPDFRSRGLAKWLKAELLCSIRDNFPGLLFVGSGAADDNEGMRTINNKIGFKITSHWYRYQFDKELIEKYSVIE